MTKRKIKYSIIELIIGLIILFSNGVQAKDLPLGLYPGEYDSLSQEDWPVMKETFNHFLSFKSINEVYNYSNPHKASYTLARMAKIEWNKSFKKEVTSYLSYFLDQLLNGYSFLKIDTIIVSREYSEGHPIYLPKNIIRTLFIIDNETACSIIKDIWEKSTDLPANSYLVNLRGFTLYLFESTNSKSSNKYFLDNYLLLKNNTNNYEAEQIKNIKLKCEIAKINDQKKVWEYLWEISELDYSDIYNDKTQLFWYKNIIQVKNVFGNIDIEIILNICDTAVSENKKYIFLYLACFNINNQLSGNPNYIIDEKIINRIENANKKIRTGNEKLKTISKENDFLMVTYNTMKYNILEKDK